MANYKQQAKTYLKRLLNQSPDYKSKYEDYEIEYFFGMLFSAVKEDIIKEINNRNNNEANKIATTMS